MNSLRGFDFSTINYDSGWPWKPIAVINRNCDVCIALLSSLQSHLMCCTFFLMHVLFEPCLLCGLCSAKRAIDGGAPGLFSGSYSGSSGSIQIFSVELLLQFSNFEPASSLWICQTCQYLSQNCCALRVDHAIQLTADLILTCVHKNSVAWHVCFLLLHTGLEWSTSACLKVYTYIKLHVTCSSTHPHMCKIHPQVYVAGFSVAYLRWTVGHQDPLSV